MLKVEREASVGALLHRTTDPVVCVSWQDAKDYTAWIPSVRNEHFSCCDPEHLRRSAVLANKIHQGAKPEDLPVKRPTTVSHDWAIGVLPT